MTDDVDSEDMQVIDALIPDWNSYQAGISDNVKRSFNEEYLKSHIFQVLRTYVSLGIEHPIIFSESFLVNTFGYWYPDAPAFSWGQFEYHPYLEVPSNMTGPNLNSDYSVEHTSYLPVLGDAYEWMILNHLWRQVPALSTLMNSGAAIWFYFFFIGYVVTRKIMSLTTLPVILLILYWGTCMLGPCALVRYIYPLFAFLPFVLAGFVAPCNNAMSKAG